MISQLNNISHQRILAVSLLGLILFLILLAVIVPFVSVMNSYDESIEELQFKLHRDKRIVAGKEEILVRVKAIKKRQLEENHFNNRETPALASADLQQFVKKAVVDAGGRLTSTQVIPERDEEHFIRIAIKVRLSGDARVLRDVLYAIEAAKPMLMIDNMIIRSVRGRRSRRNRKISPSNELNANFEVSGYMRSVHDTK